MIAEAPAVKGVATKRCPMCHASIESVSPTIGKTQKSVGVSKLQDCLHAQTGRKKGLPIDKPIPQPPQVDVGKPIGVPVPLDQDMSPREASTDTTNLQVIDLITSENKKAAEQDAALKGNISDAIQKWCSELPHPHQQRIAHIALQIMQQKSTGKWAPFFGLSAVSQSTLDFQRDINRC